MKEATVAGSQNEGENWGANEVKNGESICCGRAVVWPAEKSPQDVAFDELAETNRSGAWFTGDPN
jgi:hypothetical protein